MPNNRPKVISRGPKGVLALYPEDNTADENSQLQIFVSSRNLPRRDGFSRKRAGYRDNAASSHIASMGYNSEVENECVSEENRVVRHNVSAEIYLKFNLGGVASLSSSSRISICGGQTF
jgi:hypothetical protein